MRKPCTRLYVHCVWATWDRLPFVTADVESRLYGCIAGKCHEMKCDVLAIGGEVDHVHLLARMPPSLSVADLIQGAKGSSSHFMTHELHRDFKWQGAYGAFSVNHHGTNKVRDYVLNQKQHHLDGKIYDDWEQCYLEIDPASPDVESMTRELARHE